MTLYENPTFRAVAGDTWHPGGLEMTRQGLALCAWSEQALVADVGCGPGGTIRLLREAGVRALAFDKTPVVPDAVAADAVALPLTNASLDGVICECVLSLLPEPARAVHEFFRVLRPGGRLLCSDLTRQEHRVNTPDSCTQGALSAEVLDNMLTATGFEILHCQDHRHELKKLAAQLLWHNVTCLCTVGNCGYRQWIAFKPFQGTNVCSI